MFIIKKVVVIQKSSGDSKKVVVIQKNRGNYKFLIK
jgi:hypothetical protein